MENIREQSIPNILKKLAHVLETEVLNWKVEIPPKFGNGYCSGYVFNDHIRMLILDYTLNEELIIENPDMNKLGTTILFKFQNIMPQVQELPKQKQSKEIPSVLIATSSVNTDAVIPIHTNTASINIEVDANYLKSLFDLSEKSPVLQSLLKNTQPLLFEQIIYPSLQTVLNETIAESVNKTFKLFFLRIKAEELVCRLLIELERRDEKRLYDLNIKDIQTIYNVKEQMLKHLEIPPVIKELSVSANMSPSKLKRLFKQIFGNSIFNYYQEFRMKEAAFLLKNKALSVSDVGYQLGFTNLSHFSRVFKDHIGMKPKLYSRS